MWEDWLQLCSWEIFFQNFIWSVQGVLHCSFIDLDMLFSISEPTVSLYNTSTDSDTYSGIVQVTQDGITGRVCLNQWGEAEANVTCRSLGYLGGVPYVHVTLNTRPILMSNVSCSGRENSLFDCRYQRWGDSGPCKHDAHEAGVICYRNKGTY